MVKQPRGTVTLVFTDIVGSTRLLRELGGERYGAMLDEHRRVVREAFRARGGYEVNYEGDAFFYAFSSAAQVASAAEEALRGLESTPIRIRVGVHTGRPRLDPPKYIGLDVHLAARVMAAGHGGQVLLTRAARELVDGPVRDLGEHRLKDFDRPVALYQLGERPFPPLKTIANTNLPRPASSFVGREREVAQVVSLLRGGARLVTLVGPGGSGKTRLAIEAAAELVGDVRAGVFWVGLAGLREPSLVLPAVAQTLGASGELAEHIEERELVLLIDNFEQVVAAAPELPLLLEACPNLRLLVTSRELLRVRGEVDYDVAPLARSDAVALFCTRAQIADEPAVDKLCRGLDDLPLALELAAARLRVLTPAQILERLGERLDLLRAGRDADPRQQTLRATMDWSYGLLRADEQRLFARLAVFAGGCTLEAAQSVADANLDTLQSLAEKSLLRYTGGRYWMLETVREYALERLEASGEAETLRRRQADLLIGLAETAGFAWRVTTPERHDLVRAELANLRATLACALEFDPEVGIRLMCELEMFWIATDMHEGARWLGELLERAVDIPDALRARALMSRGSLTWVGGDYDEGTRIADEGLELFRRLGDEWGIRQREVRGAVHVALRANDPAKARAICEESLAYFRRVGSRKGEAEALHVLGYVALVEERNEDALALNRRAERLSADVGWTWWESSCLQSAAEAALQLNRPRDAEGYARRALLLSQAIGGRQAIATALWRLARAAALRGEPGRAGRLIGAVDAEAERGRLGQWETIEPEELAAQLAPVAGPEFELGIVEGKALTLDQAIAFALDETEARPAQPRRVASWRT